MDEKDSSLSIMIVPKTDKVKRISLSSRAVKSLLVSVISILLVIGLAFGWKIFTNIRLLKNNQDRAEEIIRLEEKIGQLKEANKEKDITTTELEKENESLNQKADEVEAKLGQIDKLKKQLEGLAKTGN